MEKNNKEKIGYVCSCDNCQGGGWHGGYHKHFFIRWVLGILILLIVFCLGVKIGELKGYIESEFEFNHHYMLNEWRSIPQNTYLQNDTQIR